jgi:hypothetical protein
LLICLYLDISFNIFSSIFISIRLTVFLSLYWFQLEFF